MATTTIIAGDTVAAALTTSYLATDYLVRGARRVSVALDSAAMGFTVRLQFESGGTKSQVERIIAAGGEWWEDIHPGQSLRLNVKAASGTPNAQIMVS